jgi:hypothetical protein
MAAQMQEQFRQKMEHYFTKIYTEKDMEMRPEIVKPHMIGKPVWYNQTGELMVEGIAKRCNVEPSVIRTNFENWKRAGGKPPVEQPLSSGPPAIKSLEAPKLDTPEYKRSASSGFEDDIRSTIETTRLLQELDGTTQRSQIGTPTDMNGLAAIITALKPQGGGSETGTMALIAKMQENATVRQQEGFQQSLQMQNNMTNMMMQMMQNNTNMMLGLVQNNQKPATDSKLVDFALNSLMTPQSSPEDGLVREFIGSGQAAEVARAIGDGLGSVLAARTVPTTAPPSYITQPTLPDPTARHVAQPAPQQAVQQGPTTEQKCEALMQRFYDNLTPEFRENNQYIEVLGRQVEVAINYSEEQGGDLQSQLALAERNMNLVVNLRPICTQVKSISDGTIPMDAAVNYLKTNPLSSSFIGSDYDSLIGLLTRFTAADPPGQKMLAWDVDYLRTDKAKSVVTILLEELNRGVNQ